MRRPDTGRLSFHSRRIQSELNEVVLGLGDHLLALQDGLSAAGDADGDLNQRPFALPLKRGDVVARVVAQAVVVLRVGDKPGIRSRRGRHGLRFRVVAKLGLASRLLPLR